MIRWHPALQTCPVLSNFHVSQTITSIWKVLPKPCWWTESPGELWKNWCLGATSIILIPQDWGRTHEVVGGGFFDGFRNQEIQAIPHPSQSIKNLQIPPFPQSPCQKGVSFPLGSCNVWFIVFSFFWFFEVKSQVLCWKINSKKGKKLKKKKESGLVSSIPTSSCRPCTYN